MQFAAAAACLAVIAFASPQPDHVSDRDTYEATALRFIVPDCGDLHCFRVLVPWVLGTIPGPSLLKWKTYAVLCNAAAAVLLFELCLTWSFTRRGAWLAYALTGLGFGGLYTLHDSFTSDPLMYAIGPLLTNALFKEQFLFSGMTAAVAVLAKEFAAAPLYAFAGYSILSRRWVPAVRSFIAGNFVFIVWLTLTLALMLRFNYSYGGSDSADFGGGAGVGPWLHRQSLRGIASAMFNEFSALYVLAPFGLWLAPRPLRLLVAASLPIAAVFAYVQQPDRALWNFHYLMVPLAVIVLDRVSDSVAWLMVALFGLGNLRVGAQLTFVPSARFPLAASCLVAAFAVWTAVADSSSPARRASSVRKGPANPERSFGVSVGAVLCVIAGLLAWRGRIERAEVIGTIGAVLFVLGLWLPSALKYPSAVWWRFARALGQVNARVLLTLVFAVVLTPVGLALRVAGKDPLTRRREKWPGWSPYPARYRDSKHYTRMY